VIRQPSAAPAALPQRQETTTPHFFAPRDHNLPSHASTALHDLLSTIAEILFPSNPATSKQADLSEPKTCRCCSKIIKEEQGKRAHGDESVAGESAKRRRDETNGEEGDEEEGWGERG
jgi:hypothetical protein